MNVLARGSAEIVDSALVKGNDYTDDLPGLTKDSIDSYYINELKSAKTFVDAKRTFKDQKKYVNTLSVPYYFECYEYFSKWDNNFAYSILDIFSCIS